MFFLSGLFIFLSIMTKDSLKSAFCLIFGLAFFFMKMSMVFGIFFNFFIFLLFISGIFLILVYCSSFSFIVKMKVNQGLLFFLIFFELELNFYLNFSFSQLISLINIFSYSFIFFYIFYLLFIFNFLFNFLGALRSF